MLRPTVAVLMLALAPLAATGASPGASPAPGESDWHRLVGILQYLEADYPAAVASGSKFELAEQNAFIDEAIAAAQLLGPQAGELLPRLESVRSRIRQAADPEGVSRDVGGLIEAAAAAGGLARSPRHPPDLKRGAQLFGSTCAACHGADGSGDTPQAKTMNPPPASFLDPELMGPSSAYKAFNTLSFGVKGTAMAPFTGLDEDDRWSLAFFVMSIRHPECKGKTPDVPLETLATVSDQELARRYSAEQIACLRRNPPKPSAQDAFTLARNKVDESMRLFAAGDRAGAKNALLDAYLNGVEPVEPRIAAKSPELVAQIEQHVLEMRVAIDHQKAGEVRDHGQRLLALIEQARGGAEGATSTSAVAIMALLIILREGFEALLVIAALLAVLKKMEAVQQSRVVHLGWISALLAGAVAFVFGQRLLAGANREWVEGVVALLAVGMLLYATLWLNKRSNVSAFMKELRGQMQGAIGSGNTVGLFLIAFSAVGREAFETALFLQGLSIDSAQGVVYGAAAGLLALTGLVTFVLRVGYRLPMKTLFTASTVLLFATAVVLLGQGLHALQEVGALPLRPVPMFRIEVLGIYPDLVTLVPQLLLALAPLVWRFARGQRPRQEEPGAVAEAK